MGQLHDCSLTVQRRAVLGLGQGHETRRGTKHWKHSPNLIAALELRNFRGAPFGRLDFPLAEGVKSQSQAWASSISVSTRINLNPEG